MGVFAGAAGGGAGAQLPPIRDPGAVQRTMLFNASIPRTTPFSAGGRLGSSNVGGELTQPLATAPINPASPFATPSNVVEDPRIPGATQRNRNTAQTFLGQAAQPQEQNGQSATGALPSRQPIPRRSRRSSLVSGSTTTSGKTFLGA